MEALKSILFPTDFSKVSEKALLYAIEMAYRTGARLYIFHAYQIPLVVEQGAGTMHPPQIDFEQIAHEKIEELEKKLYPQLQKVHYETVTKPGPLPDAVDVLLETKTIDLIIMGTKGAEGLKELLVGTNTADVMKKIDIPVLAVHEKATTSGIEKIALAYDYKGIPHPRALDLLKDLVDAYNAELYVLHVSETMEPERDEDLKSLEVIDNKFLEANRYFKMHLSDDVERGIEDYVTNKGINLLAVMPKEHSFFDKLFKKSISEKLTFHANVPLLILQ